MKGSKILYQDFDYSEHWADEIQEDNNTIKFIFRSPDITNDEEEEFKEWSSL
jgi:hypothetical protein